MSNQFPDSATHEFLSNGFIFGLGPDRFVIGWGEMTSSDAPEGPCSIFAPDFYFENAKPWLRVPNSSVVDRGFFSSGILPKLRAAVSGDKDQQFQWVEPEFSDFKKQFDLIQDAFKTDGLQKAVPIVHALSTETISKANLVRILAKLALVPLSLTAYGFWTTEGDNAGGLLGATPEFLFSLHGTSLKTMALAGTRSKTESPDGAQDLMNDPKERHEHQIVIDDIRSVLSNYGEVTVGDTFAAELPTLFHLKTSIALECSKKGSFMDFARSLHPTPALGIAPRALGVNFLKRWDNVARRRRYGAPFGIDLRLEDGTRVQDCVVGIRNIQWSVEGLSLGSGCGIVPQSEIDREWSELRLKRDSVRKVLGV